MTMLTGLMSRVHRHMPAPARALPFVLAVEAMRRSGWLEPPAALNGHTFRLTVEDIGLEVRFRCVDGRFAPGPFDGSASDLTLRAKVADYLRLISGDTELGLEVKYWLDAAPRPTWVGPFAARLSVLFPAPASAS
jgi:O2-independent ubiquinone biosynthesis accessory factor UbiT